MIIMSFGLILFLCSVSSIALPINTLLFLKEEQVSHCNNVEIEMMIVLRSFAFGVFVVIEEKEKEIEVSGNGFL